MYVHYIVMYAYYNYFRDENSYYYIHVIIANHYSNVRALLFIIS